MSDTLPPLPERLRTYSADPELSDRYSDAMQEAADEIERLTAGIRELVAASGAETMGAAAAAVAEPVAWSSEHHFALREAHCIGASDAYFKAWPIHDNDAGRMLFERGFVRGFDSHGRLVDRAREAAAPAAPPQREREPLTDEQIDAMRQGQDRLNFVTLREFRVIARAIERAHGIRSDE